MRVARGGGVGRARVGVLETAAACRGLMRGREKGRGLCQKQEAGEKGGAQLRLQQSLRHVDPSHGCPAARQARPSAALCAQRSIEEGPGLTPAGALWPPA